MTEQTLHLEQVEIHRVLGIARGDGWTLRDFSAGVNVIHGPNGCGKSTTARVIQELLWPGRTELDRPSVAGCFHNAGQRWQIEIDAGEPACTCDGRRQAPPPLGPAEFRRRYWLALDDLIKQEDHAFAKAIADASQGGFDLEAAAEALDYRDRPRARTRERQAMEEALANVTTAQRQQQAIEHEAQRLDELRAERARAQAAAENLALLEQAQAHRAACERCREIDEQLAALPAGVARLLGNERETLDALTARQQQLQQKQREAVRRRDEAGEAIARTGLPDAGVDADALRRMRAHARQLASVEAELRQRRQAAASAAAQAGRSRSRLAGEGGRDLTDEQLAALDRVELDDVTALARKAERVRAQQQVLAERRRWLTPDEPDATEACSTVQLREAIAALANWLATPAPAPAEAAAARTGHRRVFGWLMAAAGVIVVLAIMLALLVHWAWAAASLVGPAVAWLAWFTRLAAPDSGADDCGAHRRSFERTGLPGPAAWERTAVGECLHDLARQLAQRCLAEERAARLADLEHEQAQADREQAAVDEQREALQRDFGVPLTLADEWLPLLVANLCTWQQQAGEADAAAAAVATLEREGDALRQAINPALAAHDYAAIVHAEAATQAIDDLADRQQRRDAARQEQTGAERTLNELAEALEAVHAERTALLDRVGLTAEQAPVLDEWLAARPTYLKLHAELTREQAVRDRLAEALADRPHLLELDGPALARRIDEQRELADQRDALTEEVSAIQHRIDAAKRGHELGEALADRDHAAAELARAREANRSAIVGAALTDWVREEAVQRARPDVFRRADELLVRVTRGALQLEVDDRESPPAFRARSRGDVARPVTALSLGERVQVLMAVRLAFMEQDESTRLPLILDELLGTTDDERAAAVIDTVIECAREGRQVFCFTAQHDEAGKWIARLRDAGVPHRVIDLAQVRGRSIAETRPLELAAVDRPAPPPPGDRTWAAYGQVLQVPGLDPARTSLDDLHLWHVVHDPHALHELLNLGITTWGQLRVLLDHHGAGILPTGNGHGNGHARLSDALKAAPAAAAALEALCAAWRIGRGKPLDRAALQDAGCVSEAFIDEVSDLARSLNGDAAKLLDALEQRQVARWQQRNTDRLREYCLEQGYLSEEPPLSPEAVRARATAAVVDALQAGRISVDWLESVVQSLPG